MQDTPPPPPQQTPPLPSTTSSKAPWVLWLLVGAVVLAGAIYILTRHPNPGSSTLETYRQQQELLSLKSKCQADGKKVHDQWVAEYSRETFLLDPEYTYNSQLQTCLWSQSYTGPSALGLGQIYDEFIVDVYTNKPIIEYTTADGKQIGSVTQEQFKAKKAELFGQQ